MSLKALICWLVLLASLALPSLQAYAGNGPSEAANPPYLDLSGWQPSAGNQVLEKGWVFLPNEFLELSQLRSETWPGLLKRGITGRLPMIWHLMEDPRNPGQALSSFGFGTYILPLKLPIHEKIGIHVPKIYNAFEVYLVSANGVAVQKVAGRGIVGRTEQEHVCQETSTTSSFMALSAENYLVIQVSNFQLRRGGIDKAPVLGDERLLIRNSNYLISLKMFIIGLISAVALYNFFLYLNRPEDRPSIYLALFSLTVAIRILTSSDLVEFWYDRPSVVLNEWRNKLEYLTIILGPALCYTFFSSIYPRRFPKWLFSVVWLLALPCTVLALATSSRVFTSHLLFFQLTLLVIGCITASRVILALYYRDEGWQLSLIGGIPLFLASLVDLVISRQDSDFPPLTQYSMVIFILIQSQILGKAFSKAFRTAEKLSADLQREVERQTHEIKSKTKNMAMILENIQQGIFTIKDNKLGLDEEHSKHLNAFFEKDDIQKNDAITLLFHGSDVNQENQDMHRQILGSCIDEGQLNFELNEANLVREFCKEIDGQQHFLAVDWVPVLRDSDEIEKILVTVRDITDLRKLEQETSRHKERMSMLAEMTEIAAGRLGKFLNSAQKLMLESVRLVEGNPDFQEEIFKILFINMHTIKGNARQLGLKKISLAAHEIENDYSAIRLDKEKWSQALVLSHLRTLQTILASYDEYYQKIFGKNDLQRFVDEHRHELMESTKRLYSWATNSQDPGIQELAASIHSLLFQLLYRPGMQFLEEMFMEVDRLAKDLGKPTPQVQISKLAFGISPEGEELLQNILLHLLRNSMDHGLEMEAERAAQGKSGRGLITLGLQVLEGQLEMTLADDGRGLAISRILSRYQQIGSNAKSSLSLDEAAQLIFHDGLSTSQVTTSISGRGVGMGAVRNYLVNAGGSIVIKPTGPLSETGYLPFAFVLTIPGRFFIATTDSKVQHRLAG
jgi:signal transduction histidine kinase